MTTTSLYERLGGERGIAALVDDIVDSGGTLVNAADALLARQRVDARAVQDPLLGRTEQLRGVEAGQLGSYIFPVALSPSQQIEMLLK